MNFYHAENAGRGKIGGRFFTIYDIVGGSAFGVTSADDPSDIATLDSLAQERTSAVTAIDQAEYDLCIKKKRPALDALSTSNPSKPRLPQPSGPIKGQVAGVVVNEPTDPPELPIEIKATVETVEDALQVGAVKMAASEPTEALPKNRVKGKRENQ